MSCSIGLELTFVPYLPGRWKEYRKRQDAVKAARALNRAFAAHPAIVGLSRQMSLVVRNTIWAKADIFRGYGQDHRAWCIEIGNRPIDAGLMLSKYTSIYRDGFGAIFQCAKKLNLHPHIEERDKDGTLIDYPTGGGHIHVSISDIWRSSANLLLDLYHLERALCIDYVNYPTLRWLFAQWFDDNNSEAVVCSDSWDMTSTRDPALTAHKGALISAGIKQRFAQTGKSVYPTWELRFFDMPRDVNELLLQVTFVYHWFSYHKNRINMWAETGKPTPLKPTMTPNLYKRLTTDSRFAKQYTALFFQRIGIPSKSVRAIMETFWARGYGRRKRFGQFT